MMRNQLYDEDSVLVHIYKELSYLNPALRRIAEYILDHTEECKTITIKELSVACNVAESTITRFVRDLGFKNFQTLKIKLTEALMQLDNSTKKEEPHIFGNISHDDSIEKIIDKIIYRNAEVIKDTSRRLKINELIKAVDAIRAADTIIFCCMGSSCTAAESSVIRFTRSGKKCILFRDESLQLITASIVKPNDVVIGISDSGQTMTVVNSLKYAKANGACTIGITAFENSPLVKYSDIALFSPQRSSAFDSGLNFESTESKTAQVFIMDIIYAYYAVCTFDDTLKYLDNSFMAIRETRKNN